MAVAKAIQSTWWNVEGETKSKRKKVSLKESAEFMASGFKCGGYVPVGVAAHVMQVSRQYIYELLDKGILAGREFQGVRLITGVSMADWMDKKHGEDNSDLLIMKRAAAALKTKNKGKEST